MCRFFFYGFFLFVCFFSRPVLNAESPHLHICTTASHWNKGLDQLIESCTLNNLSVEIKGLGRPFSFDKKIRDFEKFIEELPDNDVAMFVDAYDVLILANEETILDRFFSLEAPIVFSAETACHPFFHLAPFYQDSPTKFRFLNSGSYIGYVKDLKRMFQAMAPIPKRTDDQGLFSVYYLYHPDEIYLDYNSQLFLPLHGVKNEEIAINRESKNIKCLLTHTVPCVIHGNGDQGGRLYEYIYLTLFSKE